MKYNREIERKFRVVGSTSLGFVADYLHTIFPEAKRTEEYNFDTFWRQPGVDFIRLRDNTRELTAKLSDRGDTFNRVEENLKVDNAWEALRWGRLVFGKPAGSLNKHAYIFEAPEFFVCVYEVNRELFLEVEAGSESTVTEVSERLKKLIDLYAEPRSLYQIFIGGAA